MRLIAEGEKNMKKDKSTYCLFKFPNRIQKRAFSKCFDLHQNFLQETWAYTILEDLLFVMKEF